MRGCDRTALVRRALLLALLLLSCHRGGVSSHKSLRNANVLLITLDTTRADHVGAYGYAAAQTPNVDALARDGVLFEHCITPTAYTLPSHSSIMTGLYPPSHGVRVNGEAALADSNTTLAERLSARGYRTGAFVAAFVLDGRWGLSQGFQNYDDHFKIGPDQRLDLARVQRPANQVVDAALRWLDQPSSQPFFAWVHLYDAHFPYDPPEPFRSRFATSDPKSLYDGEIAFADSQVGRLLEWLRRKGVDDNTIVVISGDHGEGLGSHGESEHGYYIYDYAVRVPLIVRVPHRKGRVADQVRTVDIAPTIMNLVTGETLKDVDGASLLPLIDGRKETTPRYAYSESLAVKLQYGWSALYGLRTNDYKYIQAPRSELYDLKDDPGEAVNRLDEMRRVALQLRDELARVREATSKRAPKTQEANIDNETMKKLASLGYLGGGSTSFAARDDKDLADPKDKMHLFDSVGYAARLISENNYKEAARVLEIVLKDDPHVPQAQLLLVSAYRQTGRTAKAKEVLDAYLKADPNNMHALIAMAEILQEQGQDDDVLAICRRAIAADARNARAYEVMADVYMARSDHRAALPLLRKVVEIQPKLTRSRNNLAAALIAVGQFDEAGRVLRDVLREYPKFPLASFNLGLLRENEGRLAEARVAYQTEITNQPKTFAARFNLGNLLLRMGDENGAEEQMRLLIKEDPADARAYLLLGKILLGRPGRLSEVESLARAGLDRAKEPDLKALGYFLLADVYSRQGRRSELQDAVRKGEHFKSLIKS